MATGNAAANGIQIHYETFGDANADPLLLVMGLGAQMTLWDPEFCGLLVERGHRVIRFDNRDVGLSTKFDAAGVPDMIQLMLASAQGQRVEVPYGLDDMADDAVGLLDHLGIERAHVVGASMGGMIVQALAIRHLGRVRTLTSIMSATGHPEQPQAKPEVMAKLMAPPPSDRDARIEQGIELWRTIGSPDYFDEPRMRERIGADYDRCFHPDGTVRQMAAIIAHGNREDALSKLDVPTLVIHGEIDPLVPVGCGQRTADAIPGAELLVVERMAHDLPVPLHGRIADAIAEHAKRRG